MPSPCCRNSAYTTAWSRCVPPIWDSLRPRLMTLKSGCQGRIFSARFLPARTSKLFRRGGRIFATLPRARARLNSFIRLMAALLRVVVHGWRFWRTISKPTAACAFRRRCSLTWAPTISRPEFPQRLRQRLRRRQAAHDPAPVAAQTGAAGPICHPMNSQIHLQQSEIASTALESTVSPMGAIWRTIRGYILWSYERGSLHYDIMVTLILLFVFISPRFINFKDKPVERNPHLTGVVVIPGEKGEFIYQIQASEVNAADGGDVRRQLERIIEPISGAVSITRYETIKDASGHAQSYKVWVEKE